MKVELLNVCGIQTALVAMRLPFKVMTKSDVVSVNSYFPVDRKDIELASSLVKAGDEHAKAMRGIIAYLAITAPRYFWQEMATYKIGCECLSSTSTMHTLAKGVTADMFDCDDETLVQEWVDMLQSRIAEYDKATGKVEKLAAFRTLKQSLPESFINTRVYAISYQTLRRIYFQRRNHRLDEWHTICDIIEELPYANELITIE